MQAEASGWFSSCRGHQESCEMPPWHNPREQVLLSEMKSLRGQTLSEQLMEEEVWFLSGSACNVKAALKFLRCCGLLADPAAVGACTSLRPLKLAVGLLFDLSWEHSLVQDVLNRVLYFHQGCLEPEAFLKSCICDLNLPTIENVLSHRVSALFLSCWSSTPNTLLQTSQLLWI